MDRENRMRYEGLRSLRSVSNSEIGRSWGDAPVQLERLYHKLFPKPNQALQATEYRYHGSTGMYL